MIRKSLLSTLFILMFIITSLAQDNLDDVHLFQNFHRDATITSNPYGEGFVNYGSYEYFSLFKLGAQGGFGINPNLEVNANLGFASFNPEVGDGASGLTDLTVAGRYLVYEENNLKATAGGFLTLPIGSEDAGFSNLDFGAFGALRYGLSNGMVITGTLGLDFYETFTYTGGSFNVITGEFTEPKKETEYKTSLVLAGGAIYPTSDQLSIVGELMIKTDVDYGMLSGGVDYKMNSNGRVRGALGLGLDDGAPDLLLILSYLMAF